MEAVEWEWEETGSDIPTPTSNIGLIWYVTSDALGQQKPGDMGPGPRAPSKCPNNIEQCWKLVVIIGFGEWEDKQCGTLKLKSVAFMLLLLDLFSIVQEKVTIVHHTTTINTHPNKKPCLFVHHFISWEVVVSSTSSPQHNQQATACCSFCF